MTRLSTEPAQAAVDAKRSRPRSERARPPASSSGQSSAAARSGIAAVTPPEAAILRQFRSYHVQAGQMLFFNNVPGRPQSHEFARAIRSLIERGLVTQEARRNAYSLTAVGYRASMAVSD